MIPLHAKERKCFRSGSRLMATAMACSVAVFGPGNAEADVTDTPFRPAIRIVLAQVGTGADAGQRPADEVEGAVRVPEPEARRQNLTQPAETTPIRSVVGYFEGENVLFTHTEISDPEIAKHLTRMIGSPTIYVPNLAEVPESALADVYIFANGVTPEDTPLGPFGYQADIFDSVPGDAGYSPLRNVLRVRWNDGADPRLLRSVAEVKEALEADEIVVEQPGIVVNMPFVAWPGGTR